MQGYVSCERTGQTITCDQYANKILDFTQFINKEHDSWYKRSAFTGAARQHSLRQLFDSYVKQSNLIGAIILYPDDHKLITTMKFLDFAEPYTGTYTGYQLLNLEMVQMPTEFTNCMKIYPQFRKIPMIKNYTLPEPNYEIVKLSWEHYTVRHDDN